MEKQTNLERDDNTKHLLPPEINSPRPINLHMFFKFMAVCT